MKPKLSLVLVAAVAFAVNPLVHAADDETMDAIDADQTEQSVMEFVPHEAPTANAQLGTDVSNMARDPDAEFQGRDFGQWTSDQVRQDVQQDVQQGEVRDSRAELQGDNADGHRP